MTPCPAARTAPLPGQASETAKQAAHSAQEGMQEAQHRTGENVTAVSLTHHAWRQQRAQITQLRGRVTLSALPPISPAPGPEQGFRGGAAGAPRRGPGLHPGVPRRR